MKLALAALLALTATAAAYPFAAPVRPTAERHAREAEFRNRNAEHFTVVEAGERGFIRRVITDDPKLATNGWQAASLRGFLRRNADLFGFDPATADRLPGGGQACCLPTRSTARCSARSTSIGSRSGRAGAARQGAGAADRAGCCDGRSGCRRGEEL